MRVSSTEQSGEILIRIDELDRSVAHLGKAARHRGAPLVIAPGGVVRSHLETVEEDIRDDGALVWIERQGV